MSNISYGQISIDKNINSQIEKLYSKIDNNHEFEVSITNRTIELINSETFLKVLEYLKLRSKIKKEKIDNTTSLDVIASLNSNYRLNINNLDTIQKYVQNINDKKSHVAFKILLSKITKKNSEITSLKKTKINVIDIDDYSIRIKLSKEEEFSKKDIQLLKNIDERDMHNILFRYKQRVSLFVEESKNGILRIDLTNTKQTNNIKNIENALSKYELEIDYTGSYDKTIITKIMKEVENLIKVINQSNYIISISESKVVTDYYNDIFQLSSNNKITLDGRKPISLELLHLIDTIPNKYAVTDKADGDRYFLIIKDKEVFMISNNLKVKKTGITLSDNKYNGSVLDGELVFLPKYNRHIFLVFDCLFKGYEDIRKISSYFKRLNHADEIIKKCFTIKGENTFEHKEYSGNFNPNDIVEFYNKEIKRYMKYLNNIINKYKKHPIVIRKIVIGSLGGQDNEIYKYSSLIWNKYVYDTDVACPYILDGVIFSPLDQKYITSVKETKYFDYKMKPPLKNSIDMYVIFEKDHNTGKILTVYDNSREEYIKGKPYRIANLHVGKQTRDGQKPVLFQENNRKHIAHLFLKDGEVRDETGAIIKDKTVVEFYYNIDSGIEDTHRWNPMRTRHDKTDIVNRYNKGYGNYIDVANKIWRSIINPITFTDIEILADDNKYKKHSDFLKTRIDHSLILSEKKENLFNQIRRNLAKPMRNFHNWIRSILIYTYFNQIYEKGKKQSVLDIGCGKGEDIMKFYYTMSDYYVGIDIDLDSLLSAANGAVSRYIQLKKTHPNFPKYTFINADAGVKLDYESQVKALGSMSKNNRSLMENYFSSNPDKRVIFDRINCQDTIQFILRDELTWNGFTKNINDYLKDGGYFVFTCFDDDQIKKVLSDTDKYTVYYDTNKGEKKVLFEIIKKYNDEDIKKGNKLGNAIDYHSFEQQEGVYITQYLVDKTFIENEFDKKSNLELIETDLYSNQFSIHEHYFKHIYKYEENEKTKEFFRKVAEFYNQTSSINKACFNLTKLYRYYVFRKKEKKIKSLKGGMNILDKVDPDNFKKGYFIKRIIKSDPYSFVNNITDILINSKIIPKNTLAVEIFKDNYQPDLNLNPDNINNILNNIKIYHDSEQNNNLIINGLSVAIATNSCNNEWNIEFYGPINNNKAVFLFKDNNTFTSVYNKKNIGYIKKNKII